MYTALHLNWRGQTVSYRPATCTPHCISTGKGRQRATGLLRVHLTASQLERADSELQACYMYTALLLNWRADSELQACYVYTALHLNWRGQTVSYRPATCTPHCFSTGGQTVSYRPATCTLHCISTGEGRQ